MYWGPFTDSTAPLDINDPHIFVHAGDAAEHRNRLEMIPGTEVIEEEQKRFCAPQPRREDGSLYCGNCSLAEWEGAVEQGVTAIRRLLCFPTGQWSPSHVSTGVRQMGVMFERFVNSTSRDVIALFHRSFKSNEVVLPSSEYHVRTDRLFFHQNYECRDYYGLPFYWKTRQFPYIETWRRKPERALAFDLGDYKSMPLGVQPLTDRVIIEAHYRLLDIIAGETGLNSLSELVESAEGGGGFLQGARDLLLQGPAAVIDAYSAFTESDKLQEICDHFSSLIDTTGYDIRTGITYKKGTSGKVTETVTSGERLLRADNALRQASGAWLQLNLNILPSVAGFVDLANVSHLMNTRLKRLNELKNGSYIRAGYSENNISSGPHVWSLYNASINEGLWIADGYVLYPSCVTQKCVIQGILYADTSDLFDHGGFWLRANLFAEQLGWFQPMKLAWDRTPFSWIVDRSLDISSWINTRRMDPFATYHFDDNAMSSIKTKVTWKGLANDKTVCSDTIYRRWRGSKVIQPSGLLLYPRRLEFSPVLLGNLIALGFAVS